MYVPIVVALALGLALFVARTRWRRRHPWLADARSAAKSYEKLVRRVHDRDVAERLGEAERRRDPSIGMATAYERALARLERERAR